VTCHGLAPSVALLALSGCSWIAVTGPTSPEAPCTENAAAPIGDAAVATPALALGLAALSYAAFARCNGDFDHCGYGPQAVGLVFGLPLTAIGGVFAASAYSGFTNVSKCRRLHGHEISRRERTRTPVAGY
jgi:hypothetical protein